MSNSISTLINKSINTHNLLYEGKGKKLYKIDNELLSQLEQNIQDKNIKTDELILCIFKDDLTAFNAQKKSNEKGKGELNCQISTKIFNLLEKANIKTHYVCLQSSILNELPNDIMFCKKVNIIPIEVVTRNIATGSLVKRLGIQEKTIIKNTPLNSPLVEFYYKDDSLNDPIVTESHCILMNIATSSELKTLSNLALSINNILLEYFEKIDLTLVDFKLEFGKDSNDNIILADEISPDSCRLWDKTTGRKMDKDRFREDLGNIQATYKEVLQRLLNSN
ncbi:phosphoribosylaminoimidazolesuccinocarboxamide synthase [Helicobacter muridarum]|uniref:Phosphoribosylaminoimidazole-succinocarboxamide synthase n=1 Tax=Helicobacter muridarum TaxID=216 RepID=A0A377PVN3_9HELI|nr:phosphoribosylaminoimidazolesuccinocarboxamide synthase [Helicobacter muridarum]TLE00927.1 phosphoribosylaminoimidazolesuccinocarboxamide synthase [Helicobacter muridarum]STQ86705.1 phosphoribosylaminoimidazole-succinocarboxamide synthase [Helicobacter muridarum]